MFIFFDPISTIKIIIFELKTRIDIIRLNFISKGSGLMIYFLIFFNFAFRTSIMISIGMTNIRSRFLYVIFLGFSK